MLRDRKRTFSLILAMVLGGCASVPQEDQSFRSVGTTVDDRTTERYLRREIIALGDQRPLRVKVRVFNGSVLLVGEVERLYARDYLQNKADRLRQVNRVLNRISVVDKLPKYQGVDDLLLAGRVRFALAAIEELDNVDMDYLVDRTNIYLLGIVTPKQGRIVVDRLALIEGVGSIVVAFDYLEQ